MIRKIVHIDEEKCTGCGLCANACHEGAIEMRDGKAHLIRDDFCDGFGDCLPECPAGAITITEREAVAYDQQAVEERMKAQGRVHRVIHRTAGTGNQKGAEMSDQMQGDMRTEGIDGAERPFAGCPGSRVRMIQREKGMQDERQAGGVENGGRSENEGATATRKIQSELQTWPVQIKLVPAVAPFFENAKLLIAADCTAYAYARFHEDFIRNHVVLIGCPKLDRVDYTDKLQAIIERNNIKSVEVVRMEVPCCGGLENAAVQALKNSGKFLPWRVVTIGIDGRIVEEDL